MTLTPFLACGVSYLYLAKTGKNEPTAWMVGGGTSMRTVAIALEPDEEKIAQLLTRDAWSYFSSPTELPNRAPVRSIPAMPRNGWFELIRDPAIMTYYLTFAGTYLDELIYMGWTRARYHDACESFLSKVERATGLHRRAPAPASDLRAAS